MKYFIICPVRNATEQQKQEMADIITAIEHLGHSVYYPARDTNQEDETGYRICTDNKNAIRDADIVLVYYDKNSYKCELRKKRFPFNGKHLYSSIYIVMY